MEAELLCRQAGSCLPQPAAACWETALPTSLTNGAGWILTKGEAEPPHLDFFGSWFQHLPSLCAGNRFSGHGFFSGTLASPAKCWLALKPPKPGFFSTSSPQRLPWPVLGWGTHLLLSGHLPELWKCSIFRARAKCYG